MDEVIGDHGIIASAEADGQRLVVRMQGEVDLNNSPRARMLLLGLVEKHAPSLLVLNLSRVPYMDSSGVAVLVELLRRLGGRGQIVLTDLQPRVRGLLEIARLLTIFKVAGSESEALAT